MDYQKNRMRATMPKLAKFTSTILMVSVASFLTACASNVKDHKHADLAVEMVEQPDFNILKVYSESPVVKVEQTFQTVLCVGCDKVDAISQDDSVLWIRLTPAKPDVKKDETIIADKHFDFDKATLKGNLSALKKIATRLKNDPNLTVLVVGHTDSKGTAKYNQVLGQNRAKSVQNWLVKQGVSKKVITTSSKGESQPIATNKTKAGRAENRRAVITINIAP